MTSTRRTMPAPPPKGVSSTCPQFSGVEARKSIASTECPRASAFSTCRWVRNHSNHCGKSVKTSAFTEEPEVDVDPTLREIDRANAVGDHRHEQLGPVGAVHFEHFDGGKRAHAPHEADWDVAVEDRQAFKVGRPELVWFEHGIGAGNGQVRAT